MNYGIPRPDLPADKLLEEWRRAKEQQPDLTHIGHACQVKIPYEIYMRRITAAQSKLPKEPFQLPTPLHIKGNCMLVGDVHTPFTDWELASLVGRVAQKHLKKPRRLIIGGDFFNMDSFSDFAKDIFLPTWKEEKQSARLLFSEWNQVFQEYVYIMGNHERRLSRSTNAEMDEDDLLDHLGISRNTIQMSKHGYCYLDDEWIVAHLQEYSINQLNVAEQLSFQHNLNVISFHEHHLAMGWDRYKKHILVNGGCLVNQYSLAYKALYSSKKANFAPGFVMYKNESPYLFGKTPFTDWTKWL